MASETTIPPKKRRLSSAGIEDLVRKPKHHRVRDFLLSQMAVGKFKVGDPLPGEISLAESLGVGRNTVRQAMGELARQGYIERTQGRGAFVTREAQIHTAVDNGVFGLILPSVRGSLYPSLIKGFGEVAAESRHALAIFETGGEAVGQGDAVLQAIDRRAAGVAIVPAALHGIPPYQLRQLEERGIPVVLCHRGVADVQAPVVTWSWEEVAKAVAREIVKRGHRRVAYVAHRRHQYTELQEKAFRQTLAEHNVELPASRVLYNDQFVNPACDDEARREIEAMLHSEERATAIFANDLDIAERVYHEALHFGLRVPENLSIVAFGGKWREGSIRQQLAGVAIDEVELGRTAAKILRRLQADRSLSGQFQQTVMPLEFFVGSSLADCKQPAT